MDMHPAVDALVQAYRKQAEPRMVGLPMYNAALELEAVGFASYEGRPCGVLIAPWFMNLVLLPGEHEDWSGLTPGKSFQVTFPAGDYRCMLSAPEGIAPHLSLPLFTTVVGFADQDSARQVAREVLRQLHQNTGQPTRADPLDAELERNGLKRPLSRRELLLGRSNR
jgi:[NiFe] hydrogenase assembly HybE family chaperone